MKKVLITGANGLLGQALVDVLKDKYLVSTSGVEDASAHQVPEIEYTSLDITNFARCKDFINQFV